MRVNPRDAFMSSDYTRTSGAHGVYFSLKTLPMKKQAISVLLGLSGFALFLLWARHNIEADRAAKAARESPVTVVAK